MLEEGEDGNLGQKQKENIIIFCFLFFYVPALQRSSAVAHDEGNIIINPNLLTKKIRQKKVSEVGGDEGAQ